jgi:hypothetical protein
MNANLRKARLIQWGLIASVLTFAGVAEIGRGVGRDDWTLWHWFVTALALWAGYGGFRLRHRLLHLSTKTLANDSVDPKSLRQWELACIMHEAVRSSRVAMKSGW